MHSIFKFQRHAISVILLLSLVGCTEKVDLSARYVFTAKTAWEYLQSQEYYSEYCDLLRIVHVSDISETTLQQILSARGHYTIFAPTNEALHAYMETLVEKSLIPEPSWDAFPSQHLKDSVRQVIVKNSIIDSGDEKLAYYTYDFPVKQNAEILSPNMYDRKLSVYYQEGDSDGDILINGCPMDGRNRDITVLNGVIHCMNQVVAPSNNTLSHFFQDVITAKRKGYYVMAQLAFAAGLKDTLLAVRDDAYEMKSLFGELEKEDARTAFPEHRYYGYTCFAEPDSLWEVLLGKDALDITPHDVYDYLDQNGIYPDAKRDGNYEDIDNLLNRFVTYHFLPWKLNSDRLVFHENSFGYNSTTREIGCAMSEFYTSMGQRRLVKLLESRESHGVYINRFPNLDNGRHGNYHELSCDPDKEGIYVGAPSREVSDGVRNAILYEIDRLLLFDEDTQKNLGRQRIRWDVAAMFPEFANNDLRLNGFWISTPTDETYRYLEDAWMARGSCFCYSPGFYPITYLGDEISAWGGSDIIFRLPPVPKDGMYEIRYGVASGSSNRTIAQIYWGNDRERLTVQGIPIDLRQGGKYVTTSEGTKVSSMGWELDTEDDDFNAELDKMLRNHNFMKGLKIDNCRDIEEETRRIIVRQPMKASETYYLRVKDVLNRGSATFLLFDYLEYCPKEVYDNPNEPEDIW